MRKLAATLLAVLALCSSAVAQSINLPAGTVYGRLGTSAGPGQAIPFATLYGQLFSCVAGTGSCLDSIAGFSSTGLLARTGTGTYSFRTLTGTSAEITVTNGSGVSGNPTFSLPSALTFTGKTITGGTYVSPTLTTPVLTTPDINGGTADSLTSLSVRSTGAAFDMLFANGEVLTANRTLTIALGNASRNIAFNGDVNFAAAFITSGANSLTLTTTGSTNVTVPTTGTLAILGANAFVASQTLTLSQNSLTSYSISNVNTGTSADASFIATNANGNAYFGIGGANYTGVALAQNRAFVFSDAALDGILINTSGNDPIIVGNQGAERARFPVTGTTILNLGLTGTLTGSLGFSGATSGTAIITAPAAAGSPTLTLGTLTGTFAVSANDLSFFAATTSAQLAGVISNETGSGLLVFGTTPTFSTSIVADTSPFTWICGSSATQDCRINITSGAGAGSEKLTILGRSNGASTLVDVRSTATGAYFRVGGAGGAAVGVDTELNLITSNASGTIAIPITIGSTLVGYFAGNSSSLQLIAQSGITVSLSANATVVLSGNSTGTTVNFPVATASTSTTTGGATVSGGLGVAGEHWNGGNVNIATAAKTLSLKQGANGAVGTFVCNGSTPVTVTNSFVAITDTIIISLNAVGGTVGAQPSIKTITASTGFTVACTASDTSTMNYAIIKNAA